MKWTQEKLEELYKEVNAKALADKEIREALLSDPKGTLEKFAGCELPDDFNLKFIETDKDYAATYVVPDFVQGEVDVQELQDDELSSVAGGISIYLFLSICGAENSDASPADNECSIDLCQGNSCRNFTTSPSMCPADLSSSDIKCDDCGTFVCLALA